MSNTITIEISLDTALEMLENRLDKALEWWSNPKYKDLYMSMYESTLYNSGFGCEFDPMIIVDNDIVNYCKVITKEDYPEDYEKLLKLYNDNERDVSCEQFEEIKPSYIESFDEYLEAFLIRY